jgi:glycosyltransferase involved in cell wall biosynthesis
VKVLSFTTLYPNAQQPVHGIFVEQRLRHLLASKSVELRVVAPVPWFPLKGVRWGTHARLASVPRQETRHGIEITHPRYPVIPKVGMTIAPMLLAMAVRGHVKRIIEQGYDFDVLDAHYYYPDGVAAAWLSRWFDKPLLITARGTDINLIPQYRLARRMILNSAQRAAASITVCQALNDEMVRIGADGSKIHTLRNGVNLAFFKPLDRAEQRRALGWQGRILLSVGHLIERKGHHLVIDAAAKLPADVRVMIVGEGTERGALTAQIAKLGLQDRVQLLGACAPERLVQMYSAADALVLASDREGMANVLLESLACGTPVVATAAWGTPEVLAHASAGVLVHSRSGEGIANGCLQLFAKYPNRNDTRRYAESFSWDETTAGQLRLFEQAIAAHGRSGSTGVADSLPSVDPQVRS